MNKFGHITWNQAIKELHSPENIGKYKNNFYQRLAFDEIFSTFLVNSEIRKKIRKVKKKSKSINIKNQNSIINKLEFKLTQDQKTALQEINKDLNSTNKMFRLLQGDVGSGKTIVSLIAALNTINSGFQVAFMAPTEILARKHYNQEKNILSKTRNIYTNDYLFMKIYIIWLIGVVLWNFAYPQATPLLDVIAAILLSFLSLVLKKYIK